VSRFPASEQCCKSSASTPFLFHPAPTSRSITPTYSSWLNQVELWFAKIERDVISRGVFTSVADLRRKLLRYIRAYAKHARPFRWTHTDPKRGITTNRITGTVH
jgi:transposase